MREALRFGAGSDEEPLDVAIQPAFTHLVGLDLDEGVVTTLRLWTDNFIVPRVPANVRDARGRHGVIGRRRDGRGKTRSATISRHRAGAEMTAVEMSHYVRGHLRNRVRSQHVLHANPCARSATGSRGEIGYRSPIVLTRQS